jgi:hypothetical protein
VDWWTVDCGLWTFYSTELSISVFRIIWRGGGLEVLSIYLISVFILYIEIRDKKMEIWMSDCKLDTVVIQQLSSERVF